MRSTVVRELDQGDLDGVGALARSAGWNAPSAADWERIWRHNPALDAWETPLTRGWVLEGGGRLAGYMYNLAQLYRLGDRTLRAAIPCNLVVAPEHRGKTLEIIMAYAKQPNVDLLLNTTAAPQTSKIFEFLKFQRIPQPEYDRSFYWVLRERSFLQAGLLKKGQSGFVSRAGSLLLAPLLWCDTVLGRRWPRPKGRRRTIVVLTADQLDGEIDDLWERKLAEGSKLLAFRTSRTLRWHYSRVGSLSPPVVICAFEGSCLVGYVGLVRQDAPHICLKRARVADILVEGDDPDIIRWLLAAAARHARRGGAAMLEMIGFPPHIRRIAQTSRPRELINDAWPFLYKAPDPDLHRQLAAPELWHASLYDGDGSL